MKKILLITESLKSGGAERQLCFLAKFLNIRGYEVKVITYIRGQFYEYLLNESGVNYELHTELSNRFLRLFFLIKIWKCERPDVVISYLTSVNRFCCLAKMLCHGDLIVSERNFTDTNKLNLKTWLTFYLYKCAKWVVPNSFSEAHNLIDKFPFLRSKIIPIINYIDVDKFVPFKTDNVKKDDKLKILTVARITSQKNCIRYVEAIKRIKSSCSSVHFYWIGDSSNEIYNNMFLNKISELGIEDMITICKPTTNIVKWYQYCDIFCLPSIYEGFPNVLCEAMSCGMPIVCSRVCDNPFIAKEGVNAFMFDPYNPSDLADKLMRMILMTDTDRELMGYKSRNIAMQLFSENKFVNSYVKLIE